MLWLEPKINTFIKGAISQNVLTVSVYHSSISRREGAYGGDLDLRQGWCEQVGVGLVHQGPEF